MICLVILFLASIGGNIFLLTYNSDLIDESYRNKFKLIENDMNLSSQQNFIERLQRECKRDAQKEQ